jgi:hypothetical protein
MGRRRSLPADRSGVCGELIPRTRAPVRCANTLCGHHTLAWEDHGAMGRGPRLLERSETARMVTLGTEGQAHADHGRRPELALLHHQRPGLHDLQLPFLALAHACRSGRALTRRLGDAPPSRPGRFRLPLLPLRPLRPAAGLAVPGVRRVPRNTDTEGCCESLSDPCPNAAPASQTYRTRT